MPAGLLTTDISTGLVEAGGLDNKIGVAGFIAEAKPGFPHAETGNRRSKQKIKNSCVCVINIYFYIFYIIFSIRLYAGLKRGQKFREVGTDWYLKGDKSSGLDKKGTKVPGVSVVAEIGTLPPLIFHNQPAFGSMKTDARTLKRGQKDTETGTLNIDIVPIE